MRVNKKGLLAAGAVAVVVTLGLAGCAGGDSGSDAEASPSEPLSPAEQLARPSVATTATAPAARRLFVFTLIGVPFSVCVESAPSPGEGAVIPVP